MIKLSAEEIISKIKQKQIFEAFSEDASFYVKIDDYVPYVCAAIHAGHGLRKELANKIALSEFERWYEEDPKTEEFIESFPIQLAAKDSRFEYDLNRNEYEAVYEEAWGKAVWKTPLSDKEKELSRRKHRTFYTVVHALVSKLENEFGGCLVYDMHSYNYKRYHELKPIFNIGAERIDSERYGKHIEFWKRQLETIDLPNTANRTEINGIFYGRGYLLEYITENFENTLVLATEISKIYCDELTGEYYPRIIELLKSALKNATDSNTHFFAKSFTNWFDQGRKSLLAGNLEDAVKQTDQELYDIFKDFDLLQIINPVNLETEKNAFFESGFRKNPVFKYRPLTMDINLFKRRLINIRFENIKDTGIQNLYHDTIQASLNKADMLKHLGEPDFLYTALKHIGEPSDRDIENAYYLTSIPDLITEDDIKTLNCKDAYNLILSAVKEYGFECNFEFWEHSVAEAFVMSNQNTVVLKKGSKFSNNEAKILANHEIGVHMVTTMNARLQPLKIFRTGLPLHTYTQEGLAVLSEYLSGSISTKRLRTLGMRVLAIKRLLKGHDFKTNFETLMDKYKITPEEAFYLTARIYRGGGFTKDYLYLSGFSEILKQYHSGKSLENLLTGKTSIEYEPIINEMIDRKLLVPPVYKTQAFYAPLNDNPIINYIVQGIR